MLRENVVCIIVHACIFIGFTKALWLRTDPRYGNSHDNMIATIATAVIKVRHTTDKIISSQ